MKKQILNSKAIKINDFKNQTISKIALRKVYGGTGSTHDTAMAVIRKIG